MKTQAKKILGILAYVVLCWALAFLTLKGLGTRNSAHRVFAVLLFWIFLIPSKRLFYFAVLPLLTALTIYAPVGFAYGAPDFQSIISLYATDSSEALEFLSVLPTSGYLKALAIPVLGCLAFYLAQKTKIKPWRNKVAVIACVVGLVIVSKPTTFFQDAINGVSQTKQQLATLRKMVNESSWHDSVRQGPVKDYVLVIGESARRDYFHCYGYPVENTPFLDKVPATIVDGFTSADTYTVGSLRLMLTDGDKEKRQPRYDRNVIDLARDAGIETVWLSNQGMVGVHDTPVSAIASRADETFFLNKKGFASAKLSDMVLLKVLKRTLDEKTDRPRLIVLHTMGSHPKACKRLTDFPQAYRVDDDKYQQIACYASTIKKTDLFLERVYEQMKHHEQSTHRPFSILYFSDHGLTHIKADGEFDLTHNAKSIYQYDVPLIKIDSDATQRQQQSSAKSGLFFTAGLAGWMGIKNATLPDYALFDGKNDKSDYGLKAIIKKAHAIDDPAIDIKKVISQ